MRYEVRAPLPEFTGTVVGIAFKAGLGEVDTATDGGRSARAYFERAGYGLALLEDEPEPAAPTPPPGEPFDPGEHRVDDVLTYLETADHTEAVRVLDAEAAGQDRVTVTGKREAILTAKAPSTPPQGDAEQKGTQE